MLPRSLFLIFCLFCLWGGICIPQYTPNTIIPVYTYRVVHTYPHDPSAFTQGLVYEKADTLIEGTGLYGQSTLRRINLRTGTILDIHLLPSTYFGEGVTLYKDTIIQVTYKEHTAFVYDKKTFDQIGTFTYDTEGWGVTFDGTSIIMSDGSATLHFFDPCTFEKIKTLSVYDDNGPVTLLNELEFIKGEIYANVWLTDRIARISPHSGAVIAWIDLEGLLPEPFQETADVLNGIAYDAQKNRLFVTGKFWPYLYEIELVPPDSMDSPPDSPRTLIEFII